MDLINAIKDVETVATRDPDWYYHSFSYTKGRFMDMLTEGIKCRKLIDSGFKGYYDYIGHNGNHYISLSKLTDVKKDDSSYHTYSYSSAFIVENIEARKCINLIPFGLLEDTRWPIRHSGWKDEYQVYKYISPDNYYGLRCSLLEWYQNRDRESLNNLQQMLLYMKEKNINLPVLDYSRQQSNVVHELDSEGYLEIYDELNASLVRRPRRIFEMTSK